MQGRPARHVTVSDLVLVAARDGGEIRGGSTTVVTVGLSAGTSVDTGDSGVFVSGVFVVGVCGVAVFVVGVTDAATEPEIDSVDGARTPLAVVGGIVGLVTELVGDVVVGVAVVGSAAPMSTESEVVS